MDARIKIIHTCNSGVSAARNTGIENATSDYIVFIDPDDTIKENYFSTIKAFMTSTSVDKLLDLVGKIEMKEHMMSNLSELEEKYNLLNNKEKFDSIIKEETQRTVQYLKNNM